MNIKDDGSEKAAKLRWRAEELARAKAAPSPEDHEEALSPRDMRQTLHELRVHQIELEMQNEELRRTQAQLDTARARYFDLYDLAPVGYCVVSLEGLILETNLTATTLLGQPRAALVKQPITRFILKEDQDIYYMHRKQFFETSQPYECDLRMVKKDGTSFWAHLAAIAAHDPATGPGKDADPAPVSRIVLSDITERKRVEETLTRSRTMLRTTQQLTRVGSWEWDVQKQTTFWTEEMYRLHNFKPSEHGPGMELMTRSLECYLPEDRPVIQAAFRRCVEEGVPYDLELRFTTAKGRHLWIRSFAEPILENGQVVRVVGFIMDITDRRLLERSGQGSE